MNEGVPIKLPPQSVLEQRRKRKFIIDPKNVTQGEQERLNNWTRSMMKKYESKLSFARYKDRDFVASGIVRPEDIDIGFLYNRVKYVELHWWIRRERDMWVLQLMFKDPNKNSPDKIAARYFFANLRF